jgi:hypothetical protein
MSSIPLSRIKRTPVCPTVDQRGSAEGVLAACQQLNELTLVPLFEFIIFVCSFFSTMIRVL